MLFGTFRDFAFRDHVVECFEHQFIGHVITHTKHKVCWVSFSSHFAKNMANDFAFANSFWTNFDVILSLNYIKWPSLYKSS